MNADFAHHKPSWSDQDAPQEPPDPHLASVPRIEDQPSILILFSDTGAGHRAAARALETALLELNPAARVVLADPLIGQGRWLTRRICSSYSFLVKGSAIAWGAIFRTTNLRPVFPFIRTMIRSQGRGIAGRLLDTHDPDVIVSVHPLLNHVRSEPDKQPERKRGHVTVLTDLAGIHRAWSNPRTDLVIVGTSEAADAVQGQAVPPERIRHLGLPIHPGFRPPAAGEQQALRRRYGLDPHRPTVLVMGGGYGNGRIRQQVRALAGAPHPWQVMVVCGRNERLRYDLLSQPFGTYRTPLLVTGFVDDIADRMRASDIVITKAGSVTIAEALATSVPLILTGHLKGQETPNLRLVEDYGVGAYVPRVSNLRATVESILDDTERLAAMKRRALALAQPDAALDIARECLALAKRSRHELSGSS